MRLSLSVRIAEGFLSKEIPTLDLPSLAALAREAGYHALCMRASQVGVHSPLEAWAQCCHVLRSHGLTASMVTGDFDTVYNNDRAPDALRNIGPYLQLAQALQATMIRVAVKKPEDIPFAQRAADQAAALGIRLVHQCHTLSLFETLDSMIETLERIHRPNFGLIYEPANLQLCGQDYGPAAIEKLAPWIFNVYLQNQRIGPTGSVTLDTWCRGPVTFDLVPIHESGGVDFWPVAEGLRSIGYTGPITAHQSAIPGEPPAITARKTADFLREMYAA
jgi:sugar phosphate isomerase/epimerase